MNPASNTALNYVGHEQPLEQLANSLNPLKDTHLGLRKKVTIEICPYDRSIVVCISLPYDYCKSVAHQAFRVFDPFKDVSERHVADNERYISFIGQTAEHRRIKEFLQSLGYQHFHNPYKSYIDKRFREHLAQKNSE